MKMWKVYNNNNINNDDRQRTNYDQEKLIWAFGSGKLRKKRLCYNFIVVFFFILQVNFLRNMIFLHISYYRSIWVYKYQWKQSITYLCFPHRQGRGTTALHGGQGPGWHSLQINVYINSLLREHLKQSGWWNSPKNWKSRLHVYQVL